MKLISSDLLSGCQLLSRLLITLVAAISFASNSSAQFIGTSNLSVSQTVCLQGTAFSSGNIDPSYTYGNFYRLTADGILETNPFVIPTGFVFIVTDFSARWYGIVNLSNGQLSGGVAMLDISPVTGVETNILIEVPLNSGQYVHYNFSTGFTVSANATIQAHAGGGGTGYETINGYLVSNSGAAPQLLSSPLSSGKQFGFDLSGAQGVYQIQTSTNLKNWIWSTNLTNNGGIVHYTDSTTNSSLRYYRALQK